MVRFKTLSRDEAKRIISAFDNYDDVEFDDLVNHWKHYDPVSDKQAVPIQLLSPAPEKS